jgi:hypothetical protein
MSPSWEPAPGNYRAPSSVLRPHFGPTFLSLLLARWYFRRAPELQRISES